MQWKWSSWIPLAACLSLLMVYPFNQEFYRITLTAEDHAVEWLTFLFAFIAGGLAVQKAVSLWKHSAATLHIGLIGLYALGCFFLAGEEISWGQRIFKIETGEVSEWLDDINKQGEMNIHNIPQFQRVRLIADLFCLVWGIIVPFAYRSRPFPVSVLRHYVSPVHHIPAYATYFSITIPNKLFEVWTEPLRLGELKEMCFSMILVFSILHLRTRSFDHE